MSKGKRKGKKKGKENWKKLEGENRENKTQYFVNFALGNSNRPKA